MARYFQILVLAAVATALTSCGQKGPLRRPEAGTLAAASAVVLVARDSIR